MFIRSKDRKPVKKYYTVSYCRFPVIRVATSTYMYMYLCQVGLDPVTGQTADIEEKKSYDVHAVHIYHDNHIVGRIQYN